MSCTSGSSKSGGFRFQELPAELRNNVYHLVFDDGLSRVPLGRGYTGYKFDLGLFRVNRQIFFEARNIFRQKFVFVRIETPWDEAQHHVAVEGHVPIVAQGSVAGEFQDYHLRVVIEAPRYGSLDRDHRKFVVLGDDLANFCKMWFYSDLSYAGVLNEHLRLTLQVQNPYKEGQQRSTVELPKAIQEQLFPPFGMIKGLREVFVEGRYEESLVKSMRKEMDVPYESPETCLEQATKLKDAGNACLQKNKPAEAIENYIEAFEKIHIICEGRQRSVWADAWFDKQLHGGLFDGQHGQIVRVVLRVRLVANMVKAYLDLKDYEEARFWGSRTIQLVRNAVGIDEDEPLPSFPAATEMGKIFYRTGVAAKALHDDDEARRLFKVAAGYLPRDEHVKRELASVSLRLGRV